jgi:hypothetical protein
MKAQIMDIGDTVVITDEHGNVTRKHGIIVGELTRAQLDACNAAAEVLDAKTVWPGGVRVFVVFIQPAAEPDEENEEGQRLQIYCDAFLSPMQPDYSRN